MHSYLLTAIAIRSTDQEIITSMLNLNDEEVDVFLAANKNLTLAQRKALLKRGKLRVASNLATSAVGDEQLRQILKDRRKEVRSKTLSHAFHTASDQLVAEVLPTLSRQDAENVVRFISPGNLRSGGGVRTQISKKLIREIASKASPAYEFALLPDGRFYSDEELILALNNPRLTSSYPDFNELADTRPVVIPMLLEMVRSKDKSPLHKLILNALIASRHIFDQDTFKELVDLSKILHFTQRTRTLHALGDNPNLGPETLRYAVKALSRYPSESNCFICADLLATADRIESNPNLQVASPWDKVTDPAQRKIVAARLKGDNGRAYPSLMRAATPYANPDGTGAVDLANIDLADYAIRPAEATKSDSSTEPYELLTYEIFEACLYPLLRSLGRQGWDLFFRLSSEWKSSVAALLETVTSLSS